MTDERTRQAVLDALAVEATVLQLRPDGEKRTDARGTCEGGEPYMHPAWEWPSCQGHGVRMSFVLQVDLADARHAARFSGLYVAFQCAAPAVERLRSARSGRPCPATVLHDPVPRALALSRPDEGDEYNDDECVWRGVETRLTLPPACILDDVAGSAVARLESGPDRDTWRQAYEDLVKVHRPDGDHMGGWHYTRWDRCVVPSECTICDETLVLVVQFDTGDPLRSLWACPDHPGQAHYACYR